MRFLILGSNGMAGNTIAVYLKETGHEVLGYARERSLYFDSVIGDAYNTVQLKEVIDSGNFDSIINCVGLLNQFAENNKPGAVFLNSYLPHYLAGITEGTSIQVVHMSTDCVFSGEKGNYLESDFPDGKTFYDRTKALGELNDDKNITLRNSIVGPDIKASGIGLLSWFMKQRGTINGFTKAMWTGQTTVQLAKTMEYVAKERMGGLYNAVPHNSISKYELLKLFNKYLRDNSVTINPVEGIVADKSLVPSKLGDDFEIPNYEQMVAEMALWMRAHKEMYPHYEL